LIVTELTTYRTQKQMPNLSTSAHFWWS